MQKHTLGPWKFSKDGPKITGALSGQTYEFIDSEGFAIGYFDLYGPDKEANAKLISLAPQMLAVIGNLLSTTELNMDDLEEFTRKEIRKAQNIIAQAIGAKK